jgi:hypothetical protein
VPDVHRASFRERASEHRFEGLDGARAHVEDLLVDAHRELRVGVPIRYIARRGGTSQAARIEANVRRRVWDVMSAIGSRPSAPATRWRSRFAPAFGLPLTEPAASLMGEIRLQGLPPRSPRSRYSSGYRGACWQRSATRDLGADVSGGGRECLGRVHANTVGFARGELDDAVLYERRLGFLVRR